MGEGLMIRLGLTLCGVNFYIVCMTRWTPSIQEGGEPLYLRLADAIDRDIYSGALPPGFRLPPHRELADDLGINVSTVTKGYGEARRRGLVCGAVGRGTFVASDAGTNVPLVSLEPKVPGFLEMGLIEPLYGLDPDVSTGLRTLARRRNLEDFLRYGDPRGMPEHRKTGAKWASRYGVIVSPDEILVCSGNQHGLACCLSGLFRPGDRIAVNGLTYPGFKTLAAMLGLRLVPVSADEEGITPQALDAVCNQGAASPVKGVYVNPGAHNPTTARMSLDRRKEIARVARKRDIVIIEDDAYDLTLPGETAPIYALAPERTVLAAGVSKVLAAGLRVGFLAAPREFQKPLAQAALNTVWMTPPLTVALLCQWIEDGEADRALAAKRKEASARFRLARTALPGWPMLGEPSGYFFWLPLPDHMPGAAFEAALREHGVNVFGAEKFAVGDASPPNAARISLTGARSRDELARGLSLIAQCLAGRLDSPMPLY